jgi:REG-2-like HAD superfamily hydrolase
MRPGPRWADYAKVVSGLLSFPSILRLQSTFPPEKSLTPIPLQAIFLDAGNTLFTERRPRHELYANLVARFGCAERPVEMRGWMSEAYGNLPDQIDGHFRFSIGWFRHFHQSVLTQAGLPEHQLDEAHNALVALFENPKTYHLFEEVVPFLTELANRKIPVCVISNWSERLPRLIKGLGLKDLVAFTVTSAELRSEKPSRAIFERALFRAGASAERVIHIGDHLDRDVRGALNAGLRAILLDRTSQHQFTRETIPVASSLHAALGFTAPALPHSSLETNA